MSNPTTQRFLQFMAKNNAEVRVLMENLLPLLIMLLADWSPLLVLFYFFLDLLVKLTLEYFKYRKIISDKVERKQIKAARTAPIIGYVAVAIAISALAFILILLAGTGVALNKTGWVNAIDELWKMVKVDYWIFPLLGLNGWMLYKMEFVRQMQYRILPHEGYLGDVIKASIPMLLLLGGAVALAYTTSIGTLWVTVAFILLNTVSDFFLLKQYQKKLKAGLTI